MALDQRYVVASDLEQYFVRKDNGLPLSNGTLTFYRDAARNVPKPVYQLSGFPPNYTYASMGAQITLSAVGTVQNSGGDNEVIYYYPYDAQGNIDLYYVVARDSGGNIQFTREAWPNGIFKDDSSKNPSDQTNQISNPTFTNVLINSGVPTTYTANGTNNSVFNFAPDWDFVISGTGTVIVQQIPITGNEKVPASPPYALDVQVSSSITACYLRQRFNKNSGLWASTTGKNIFLSGSFVARNESVGTTGIQMFYKPSAGGNAILIVDSSFQGDYVLNSGSTSTPIPLSNDTNSGYNGFVDIYLSFMTGSHVKVTSISLIPSKVKIVNFSGYDTNSSNRNESYQGDYYIPRNNIKRIPSYLTGWDFAVNPFQFGNSGTLLSSQTSYIADQTIALSQGSGTVSYLRANVSNGFEFNCTGTSNAFYLMQYLSGQQVKQISANRLSVNIFAYQDTSFSQTDAVTVRVYLFRAYTGSNFPLIPLSIVSLGADGQVTLTAPGWTSIPRSGLDTPQAKLNFVGNNDYVYNTENDIGFSGWAITDDVQLDYTNKFAIVVTFAVPDSGTQIVVNSISLVPGDLPCRPGIQSYQQVLRECQFYYEKSYELLSPEGTVTTVGSILQNCATVIASGKSNLYPQSFYFRYKTTKISAPILRIFSPNSGLPNQVFIYVGFFSTATQSNAIFSNFWSIDPQSTDCVLVRAYNPVNLISVTYANWNEAFIQFHYVADARLGIAT